MRPPNGRAFVDALRGSPAPRVIAECKRRSPSRGILRARLRSCCSRPLLRGERGRRDIGADRADVFRRRARTPACRSARPSASRCCGRTSSSPNTRFSRRPGLARTPILLIVGGADRRGSPRAPAITCPSAALAALVEVHDATELTRAIDAGREVDRRQQPQPPNTGGRSGCARRLAGGAAADAITVAESGIRTRTTCGGSRRRIPRVPGR